MKVVKGGALALFIGLVALSMVPPSASSRGVTLGISGSTDQYAELSQQGIPLEVLSSWVTWAEPSPAPLLSEAAEQNAEPFVNWQPEGSEGHPITVPMIDAGELDSYIAAWADKVAAFPGPVYIRLAHEMNGTWYPWSKTGPVSYRAMWRHVVPMFKSIAPNARFLWSPDGLIGHDQRGWAKDVTKWYPGAKYVDFVGMSTVGFKTSARYGLPYFFRRIDFLRRHYRKPVILPEMKVYQGGRYRWLQELREILEKRSWVKMLIWSETRSTAQALGQFGTGNMNWSLTRDPRARSLLLHATGR